MVIGAIVIGVVLAVVLTRPKGELNELIGKVKFGLRIALYIDAATASTTLATTIASANISVVWSFDSTATDLNNVYNGSTQNGATYSNGIPANVPYFGSGQALSLNGVNQFVSIPSPFLPLNFTSFTIESWIYPSAVTNDRGIFGQCQCSTCANQCLYFICRGGRVFIDFTMNDLYGSATLVINTWYHVAFVYNYQTQQQILYVNGVQDAMKSNVAPYQGTNGSIQIGATQVFATTNFFNGFIDNVWVTTRAKSSDEILRDASLMVYYSFDLPNTNTDSGPNKILGNSINIITVNGRVNQAIRFVGSSSFFQSYGLSPVPAGVINNRPFSVSLWANPTISGSCSFVQFFTITPARCANFLGIFSNGGSTGQIFVQGTGSQAILTGPFIAQNIWTHISVTFSTANGYSLYANGDYFGTASSTTYTSGGTLTSLYVGYYNACSGVNQNSPCQGSVDEVYIHNRELTQLEVTVLANP